MKTAYVILHFNCYKMTCKCIDSLLKIVSGDSNLVVVDNHSNNKSGEKLKKKYRGINNIYFILSKENVGFARGNNLGYIYAKNTLNAETIIVMNNDVIITQKDFEKKLNRIALEKKDVDIVAPDVINRVGEKQNPYRIKRVNSSWMIKSLVLHMIYYVVLHIPIVDRTVYRVYQERGKELKKQNITQDMENIVPHGSCIVFLYHYIKNSDFAFPPITYFYGEEDVLYDYVVVKHMKTIYTSTISVKHYENVSTKSYINGSIKQEKFRTKNRVYSLFQNIIYRKKNNIL